MERAADIFFRAALQAMAVRDDEIVEIPTQNRIDAPPHRRLVPNAELEIQGDTAMVGSRSTESVLTNSGGRRRSSQAEAEAAVRTLIE